VGLFVLTVTLGKRRKGQRLTQSQAQPIHEVGRGVHFITPQTKAQGEGGTRLEDFNVAFKKKKI